MKKFRVSIAESITHKEFVAEIAAETEEEARKKAMQMFFKEHWEYSAHCRITMCNEIIF